MLQELIAPTEVEFYDRNWNAIGSRSSLAGQIHETTGFGRHLLRDPSTLTHYSYAVRLSWAAERETSRPEDRVYSMMGILDVSLDTQYGVGIEMEFARLQELLFKKADPDHSLFAWARNSGNTSLLAPHPNMFRGQSMIKKSSVQSVAPLR